MKRQNYLSQFLLVALLAIGSSLFAQTESAPELRRWSAQLNFQQQDLLFEIPVGQLGVVHQVRLRPRVTLEAQRFFREGERGRAFGSAQIGYYHNLYHDRWLSFKAGIGYEWKFGSRFFGSLRMEGGAARVKRSDVQYIYEDGVWVPTKNEAKANVDVLLSPRVDVGYRVLRGPIPMDIVANADLTLNANSRIGLIPFYGLGLGFRIEF